MDHYGADAGRYVVEFRADPANCGSNCVLKTLDTGEKIVTQWQLQEIVDIAPVNTRVIRVRVIARRYEGLTLNASFDAMTLEALPVQPLGQMQIKMRDTAHWPPELPDPEQNAELPYLFFRKEWMLNESCNAV